MLVALSEHKAIGADIEFMDPRLDMESMAPEIMCAAELEYFRSLVPAEERRQYFFRLFSAKEALIKAFGTGLYYDVKQIDTTAQRRFARNNTFFSWHDRSFYEKQYSMALCLEE